MTLGRHRYMVTVQVATETRDLQGDPIKSWDTHCQRKALIEPLSGREYWQAQQVVSEATYRFKFRYDTETAAITEKMRIMWGTRIFNISQPPIDLFQAHRELTVMCTEER